MESYFKRWASVAVSVRSLAATNSISGLFSPARTTFLPIRPKPLIPTLVAIDTSILRTREKGPVWARVPGLGGRLADSRQRRSRRTSDVSVRFFDFDHF